MIDTIKSKDDGLSGLGGVSYNFALPHHFIIGAGANVNATSAKTRIDANLVINNAPMRVTATVTEGVAVTPYIKLGYVYHHNLFSTFLGASFRHSKTTSKLNIGGVVNPLPDHTNNETALVIGGSLAQPLAQHLHLFENATYYRVSNETQTLTNPLIAKLDKKDMHAISFGIGLSYLFN